MPLETITLFPLWAVAFLLSVTVHEAAHAVTALRGGDRTAYLAGQASLDPLPHIKREPIGMVLVPIITFFLNGFMFGWASAPLDPYWVIRNPKAAAWVSLAGPLSNLALMILTALIMYIGVHLEALSISAMPTFSSLVIGHGFFEGLGIFLSILFSLNSILFFFNLIPLPPLDGASVLGLFVKEEWALKIQILARDPQFSMISLFIIWFFAGRIISPLYSLSVMILYSIF